MEKALLIASVVVFVGIIMGKLGSRYGVPALLLFLFTGMIFGSDGLGLEFSNVQQAQQIGTIALSIILFTGGMDTRLQDIRPILAPGLLLSTMGVVLTTVATGLFIYLLTGELFFSLLIAAAMSSTDSASVFGLLRSQRIHLKENLKPVLELESGSNDPMAYMLTIMLIDILLNAQLSWEMLLLQLVIQFIVGAGYGLFMGYISVWIINHIKISNRMLYPIILLCLLFATFSITGILRGNGFLAVYVLGIVVGNQKLYNRGAINHFFDGITWLIQIILFIILGLLVNPGEMGNVLGFGVLIALFIMFVARPLACFITLLPFRKMSLRAKTFVSWVGLRGAAPIIFATYPVVSGVPESSILFNIVFVVTLLSLLVQGMTISPIAKKLGLATPAPPEGNFIGVEIPEELGTHMEERLVTPSMLSEGNELQQIELSEKELVILVRRNDRFIVPKGKLKLRAGDILLLVSELGTASDYAEKSHRLLENIKKSLAQQIQNKKAN